MSAYTCKACGRAVIVVSATSPSGEPRIIRACNCGDSTTVVANASATVKGHASLATPRG